MKIPLPDKPIVIVDIETTGLEPALHEIIEISLIDAQGQTLLHTKIKPEHLDTAEPKALEINGYNEEAWADAVAWDDVALKVKEELTDVVILGQNVSFDMGFIKTALTKASVGTKGVSYHTVDTVTLAYEHLVPCGLRSVSLGAVCDFLGISNEGAHTALADTQRTLAVYKVLNRATWFKRLWWRWVGPRRAKAARARTS